MANSSWLSSLKEKVEQAKEVVGRLTENPVGHVATDFGGSAQHVNTLRVRPRYRISLRLGDFEDLFEDPPDSRRGRMARLQVLGLFYLPLNHRRVVEGAGASDPYSVCWEWVKAKVFRANSDADADAFIQKALRERIVSGSARAFGEVGTTSTGFGLPPDGRFAKIRIPGGYTYMFDPDEGRNLLNDPRYPLAYGENIRVVEDRYGTDNPALWKIPIVAKVERLEGKDWRTVSGAFVYFQILSPDALPDPDEVEPVWDNFKAIEPKDPGVAEKLGEENPPAEDDVPHATNCPAIRGGSYRREFLTQSTWRFHEKHKFTEAQIVASRNSRSGSTVRSQTNEEGEAGVIFLPSRMGGDRYKIRAYVGPPTLAGKGDEPEGVRVDTGTMVVWRNIRVSRILRKEAPRTVWPPLLEHAAILDGDTGTLDVAVNDRKYLHHAMVMDGQGQWYGMANFDFDGLAERFAQAFCELEADEGADTPATISDAEYAEAYEHALRDAKIGKAALGLGVDLSKLFFSPREPGSLVTRPESVAHLVMRTPRQYESVVKDKTARLGLLGNGQVPPYMRKRIHHLLFDYALPGFLRGLSKGGLLPGLTLVEGPAGNNWSILGLISGASGSSFSYRGAFVWYGGYTYSGPQVGFFPFSYDANHAHEIGHCMFRVHAPGNDPGQKEADGVVAACHDDASRTACLMSYKYNQFAQGYFCAHCLLALRGWDITGMSP